MFETLIGSAIVAVGAFLGIVLGFALNLWDRKLARRELTIQRAEEAVAAVVAARYPPANVELLATTVISSDDWTLLRRELEMESARRLVSSAGHALSALAAAGRYAPALRPIIKEGSSAVVERPHSILQTLAEA